MSCGIKSMYEDMDDFADICRQAEVKLNYDVKIEHHLKTGFKNYGLKGPHLAKWIALQREADQVREDYKTILELERHKQELLAKIK